MAYRKTYIGSDKEYVHFTQEELAQIRRTDMLDFLERKEGFSFKRAGSYFKCVEHNSLIIYPNHQMWVWNSRNLKGLNCIDWLQKVDGYSFQDACAQMISIDSIEATTFKKVKTEENKKEPVPLDIPERQHHKYTQVFCYLTKSRCIDPDIVNFCFHQKLIYQDIRNNAIFVGYDEDGNMKCLERRSTNTFMETKFRGNTAGSNLEYSFNIPCDNSEYSDKNRVYVFEAPIDLLSHCTMMKLAERSKNGDHADENCWRKQNRLALSGTSDVALEAYLKRNPHITEIDCCLDNDEAGIKAADIIKEKYKNSYKVTIHRVKNCKDYNEALQNYCKAISLQKDNQLGENNVRDDVVTYTNGVKR